MIYKAVLFDLDGTLIDTLQDIAYAVDETLEKHRFPTHDLSDYRSYISDGVVMLITRSLPEDHRNESTITACVEAFHNIYDRCWYRSTEPFDGIVETLRILAARRIKLAVLSNKTHQLTEKCVQKFFPEIAFDMVLGLKEDASPKPDPVGALHIAAKLQLAPSEILFVGDSAADMKTATAAGMLPVGVLWGFKTAQELRRSGARKLIASPQEIIDFIA
jgi:phosphoglycolate phosphatase